MSVFEELKAGVMAELEVQAIERVKAAFESRVQSATDRVGHLNQELEGAERELAEVKSEFYTHFPVAVEVQEVSPDEVIEG